MNPKLAIKKIATSKLATAAIALAAFATPAAANAYCVTRWVWYCNPYTGICEYVYATFCG